MTTFINCLVKGCSGRETSHTNLHIHYIHRHLEDTIVVLNKGPCPHPWRNQCNIFIPQKKMLARHLGTTILNRVSELKHRHLASTTTQIEATTEFWVWNQVLEKLDTFKYLDMMLYFYEIEWPMVDRNLQIEQRKWFLSTVLLSVVSIGRLH